MHAKNFCQTWNLNIYRHCRWQPAAGKCVGHPHPPNVPPTANVNANANATATTQMPPIVLYATHWGRDRERGSGRGCGGKWKNVLNRRNWPKAWFISYFFQISFLQLFLILLKMDIICEAVMSCSFPLMALSNITGTTLYFPFAVKQKLLLHICLKENSSIEAKLVVIICKLFVYLICEK